MNKEVNPDSMKEALSRLKHLGFDPSGIIDVGAASGSWTRQAIQHWPSASFYLIEPLEEQQQKLQKLKETHSNLTVYSGVAGKEAGFVNFSVTDDLDGSGVYGDEMKNVRQLPVIKIDDILQSHHGPVLIKLDTHGYEIPILEGAIETLKRTDALIIEVYGFYVSPTALLFHQLSAHLESQASDFSIW